MAQALLSEHPGGWTVFLDATVYARYLVAIWVMIVTESFANERINMLIHQFRSSGLLDERDQAAFESALINADRSSGSQKAELVLLLCALLFSLATNLFVTAISVGSWEGSLVNGEGAISWAGYSAIFFSNTLFLFLVFRWFWRFYVWASLLRRISKLDLQLIP